MERTVAFDVKYNGGVGPDDSEVDTPAMQGREGVGNKNGFSLGVTRFVQRKRVSLGFTPVNFQAVTCADH